MFLDKAIWNNAHPYVGPKLLLFAKAKVASLTRWARGLLSSVLAGWRAAEGRSSSWMQNFSCSMVFTFCVRAFRASFIASWVPVCVSRPSVLGSRRFLSLVAMGDASRGACESFGLGRCYETLRLLHRIPASSSLQEAGTLLPRSAWPWQQAPSWPSSFLAPRPLMTLTVGLRRASSSSVGNGSRHSCR